jgi:hypothetical protein
MTNSQCVTGTNPADRVNVDIENNSDSEASLTSAEYVILVSSNLHPLLTMFSCENAIKTEFGACSTGSEQQYGSFHYVIDPNAGSC